MSTISNQLDFIRDEVRGAWRFQRLALAVAWAAATAGWIIVLTLPDKYEARTRVYVETNNELGPLLRNLAVQSDVQSKLDLVRQSLLARPSLEKVASSTQLVSNAWTKEQREKALDTLSKSITLSVDVDRSTQNYLYTMAYRDSNRDRSVAVVRTLLDALIDDVTGQKKSSQESAQKFLEQEISNYEKRLSVSETRLAEFKKRNLGLVPGENRDYFSRLQTENDALEVSRSALNVAQRRLEELSSQLRGATPYTPVGESTAQPSQSAMSSSYSSATRLQESETRLQELLLRYTDQHPEVIALRETIKELQARENSELEALKQGKLGQSGGRSAFLNPIYQQIQLQLNANNVEIAALRGQVADHQRRSAELRKLADTAPEVEAQYAKLNRDYGVTKTQYQSMVERLEQARLSDKANDETGAAKFNVIDPPVARLEPVEPKRGLLATLVLFVSLAAGAASAYALHLLKPVFLSTKALLAATGLPVLGSIGSATPEKKTIRFGGEFRRAAIALCCLFLVFILVLLTNNLANSLLRKLLSGA
jgi:polysaccharide chain length determinant protein (PEP-CTERM system associated)